ncbi:hypothetical protein [Yersinia ruckeri]|nr:hypothetical protein [Yersinia ruckeri]
MTDYRAGRFWHQDDASKFSQRSFDEQHAESFDTLASSDDIKQD